MRCAVYLLATAVTLGVAPALQAQPAPTPGQGPTGMRPGRTMGAGGPKVCAIEMKPTTKVVYGSICKEYCRPNCCIGDFFRACCGTKCSDCGNCGAPHTTKVLMKKVVPGPDVPVCRVKDLSAGCIDLVLPAPVGSPKSP